MWILASSFWSEYIPMGYTLDRYFFTIICLCLTFFRCWLSLSPVCAFWCPFLLGEVVVYTVIAAWPMNLKQPWLSCIFFYSFLVLVRYFSDFLFFTVFLCYVWMYWNICYMNLYIYMTLYYVYIFLFCLVYCISSLHSWESGSRGSLHYCTEKWIEKWTPNFINNLFNYCGHYDVYGSL